MPLYRFECKNCGNVFISLGKGEEVIPCKECGSLNTRRLLPQSFVGKTNEKGKVSSLGGRSCAGCQSSSCSTCR